MIYADFESILVPEDNRKQNHEESYTNKFKKHVACNKERVMVKEDDGFGNSTKCWISGNIYVDDDGKVRDHCHITGKDRGFEHRDYNSNVILNHKFPIPFNNLKNYDSCLIIQELGKFNFKCNTKWI